MKNWYLIHTKPRQENAAKENLQRQGYEIYLPLASVRRRRRGRTIRVTEAMFPRYLFIHLSNQDDDWRPIRSTIGVAAMVKFGQEPARVPDSLISSLLNREDENGVLVLAVREFQSGDAVKIMEGPMEGYEGIFHSHTGKERVSILLKIAQKSIRVQLASDQIEPV